VPHLFRIGVNGGSGIGLSTKPTGVDCLRPLRTQRMQVGVVYFAPSAPQGGGASLVWVRCLSG
jgi:hypothetical protein